MEIKLRSILEPIHWSLTLKALVFGLAWLYMPYWFFLAIGLILYFIPFFQPSQLVFPFILLLIFSRILEANFWNAVFLGVIFLLILGIKDLIFVNRRNLYELLVIFITMLGLFELIFHFGNGNKISVFIFFLATGLLFFWLTKEFVEYSYPRSLEKFRRRQKLLFLALPSLLTAQIGLAALFLPLNSFEQTIIIFFPAAIFVESIADYLRERLDRDKILVYFSVFFAVVVLLLGTAKWRI